MHKKRLLLKMSGEVFGERSSRTHFSVPAIDFIANEIVSVADMAEMAIVVGGGNLLRGAEIQKDLELDDSAVCDYVGMLATVMNALIFQGVLEQKFNIQTRVMTATEMRSFAELFIRRRAIRHLEKGRVIILAGGTGNPNFSTDTAMVLRAHELNVDMTLKGTKVDGIYDKDPKKHFDAEKFETISHTEYLARDLKILDSAAVALARNLKWPISVFNIFKKGNLKKIISGKNIGSVIS
ncbi:MAG: UMP kinase [Candidatus Yanofskybacteria bacterium RIFCSPHIGHO2_02_FULL_41_11]|uniref:Uridylate kinase n=1 Tax=Candidatus Yanofskybacteria bacterium RIFCSPHIGHO2_02_FULL_41_11 TaxID=1802675 RepID=A0A1F8F9Y4_9BACT|nr:MAG: UMP kinase [Candidatus Yanofskybacteria bacterium RIFCSPHIGHO2_02_FULL_41_11]